MSIQVQRELRHISCEMKQNVHRWQPRGIESAKQASLLAVAFPFIVVTSIVMGLRLFVRLRLVQGGLGLDDRKFEVRCRADVRMLTQNTRSYACWIRFYDWSFHREHYVRDVWRGVAQYVAHCPFTSFCK